MPQKLFVRDLEKYGISKESFETPVGGFYRSRTLVLTQQILNLKKGEYLFISKEEWEKLKLKSSFTEWINSRKYMRRSKLKDLPLVLRTVDNGWILTKFKKLKKHKTNKIKGNL